MAVPKNTAFETALKIHLDTWASDPRSFRDTSTLAEVLLEVKRFEAHSYPQTISHLRKRGLHLQLKGLISIGERWWERGARANESVVDG